ncbi:hypothetical protein PENNAL_c0068G01789, partial [Penicillium nalgiovense]
MIGIINPVTPFLSQETTADFARQCRFGV